MVEFKSLTAPEQRYWGAFWAETLFPNVFLDEDKRLGRLSLNYSPRLQADCTVGDPLVNHISRMFPKEPKPIAPPSGKADWQPRLRWSLTKTDEIIQFLEPMVEDLPYRQQLMISFLDFVHAKNDGVPWSRQEELYGAFRTQRMQLTAIGCLPSAEALAAITDRRGKISVRVGDNNEYYPEVYFSSLDRGVPFLVKDKYGGTLAKGDDCGNVTPSYPWKGGYKIALQYLEDVLPHLVVLKDQAEWAINFQQTQRYLSKTDGPLAELLKTFQAEHGIVLPHGESLVDILREGYRSKLTQCA